MNRLAKETSPYLLQHAHNPVDWYPWGQEAIERAQKEDKPILVSIGYSTCHWCHVMERESFENPEVAALMNEHFVNIKIDREERPDLDQIYMEACQLITGSGGWPLNCFLLPDGRPFFAGTYFPPQPFQNRPSWPQLLEHLAGLYAKKRDIVEDQAERLTKSIDQSDEIFFRNAVAVGEDTTAFYRGLTDQINEQLLQRSDRDWGGFGGAPKFPAAMALRYLLHYHYYTGSEQSREHLVFSLDKMIQGGLYDQIGGGFARYATDRAWRIPHFEKMLYDNALLTGLLADCHAFHSTPRYARTVRESLDFIAREMTHPDGGFYSALDADSEGEEGKFYVWKTAEIQELVGDDFDWFAELYHITPQGNWEGVNILFRDQNLEAFAEARGLDFEHLRHKLDTIHQQLMARRDERVRPGLDDKILLAWNAMMVSAYLKAYRSLGETAYRAAAEKNVAFLRRHLRRSDGTYYHGLRYHNGQPQPKQAAFLDDYALLIRALLDLYQVNFDASLLEVSLLLTQFTIAHFSDPEDPLLFYTPDQQTDVILRKKELFDNAVPSGNSTMAGNLLALGLLLDRPEYSKRARAMLEKMIPAVSSYPSSFAGWANTYLHQVYPIAEIAVVGPQWATLAKEVGRIFVPGRIMEASASGRADSPLLAGKEHPDQTRIYLCENYACQLPVVHPAELQEQLAARRKTSA